MTKKNTFLLFAFCFLALVGLDLGVRAIAEAEWFQAVGYWPLAWGRAIARWGLFGLVGGLTLLALGANLRLAERLRRRSAAPPVSMARDPRLALARNWWEPPLATAPAQGNPEGGFGLMESSPVDLARGVSLAPPARIVGGRARRNQVWLALTVLGLGLAAVLLYYGQVGWEALQPWNGPPALPPRFSPIAMVESLGKLVQDPGLSWLSLVMGGVAAGVLGWPGLVLRAIVSFTALLFAVILANHWGTVCQAGVWLAGAVAHNLPRDLAFQARDPAFGLELGWYFFALPLGDLLEFWSIGVLTVAMLSALLFYLSPAHAPDRDRPNRRFGFGGFSAGEFRHLCGLAGGLLLATAVSYGLACLELVYSERGATYGAGFTDLWVQWPANVLAGSLAALLSLWLLAYALTGQRARVWVLQHQGKNPGKNPGRPLADASGTAQLGDRPARLAPTPDLRPRDVWRVGLLYGVVALVGCWGLPGLVQGAIVAPNEFERERPYLERNLAATRVAFGLEAVQTREFFPEGGLTAAAIARHAPTINNLRLWDTRPLLATNRQLQQLRPYYRFASADLDRYRFGGRTQQVFISARELDYAAVPAQAQTWLNQHLVYTHGYGFTLSPVNEADAGGLPKYFVRDIRSDRAGAGQLQGSEAAVGQTLPLDRPRLYYGELTDSYVLAPTAAQEFDYPRGGTTAECPSPLACVAPSPTASKGGNESGSEGGNAYNHYDGQGGIRLGDSWVQRGLFAWALRDWQLLLTDNLRPNTRLLWRRNIVERVKAIAPFLSFDRDPYLVVADLPDSPLHWVIDAYTTSRRYPYAEPHPRGFNYIRNAVKVVVDAYNGTVQFYWADPKDPISQVWAQLFPDWLQPLDRLPPLLRQHLRYPIDLLEAQSDRLLTYHINDPQVFYNREDLWQIPNEIYGGQAQKVEPYFAILQLTTEKEPEFAQLLPFSPAGRGNLIGWLAARSDGDNYGKLLLYRFPKDRQIFGTEQMEARINQDPEISRQFGLWNRQGARAVQGNLLIVPIERSLLYIEPIYLEATERGLPTLTRVIAAEGTRIVMKPTLKEAIAALFDRP